MISIVQSAIENKAPGLFGLGSIGFLVLSRIAALGTSTDQPILNVDSAYPITIGNIMEYSTWGVGVILATITIYTFFKRKK